ncbi:MAG: zf-HC2 domain-containing protein [Gemmatimonadetes bacterium]|nr:zf-HC2 domain-containing protein [Gemmatimonadota bacterium]
MTSTPGREIDCAEAIEHLYPYLDGELTAEIEGAIRRHLAVCARCSPEFELERGFLRFVEARTRLRRVPEPLRRRVFDALFTGERKPPG